MSYQHFFAMGTPWQDGGEEYEDRSHDMVAEHQLRRVLAGARLADVFAEARL